MTCQGRGGDKAGCPGLRAEWEAGEEMETEIIRSPWFGKGEGEGILLLF